MSLSKDNTSRNKLPFNDMLEVRYILMWMEDFQVLNHQN